jgi:hypothetical protein
VKLNVTFETGHPARLEGLEGAVAVVFQDERPVQGVAVRADWRLNGFLSRLLMDGRFTGERGDWLLLHTQGRLPYTRLFLVGMGRKQEREIASSRRALAGIASKVALAGVHSFAIDLSEVIPAEMAADDAMVVFLEALSQAYPEDVESNPPYLPALNARERNEERVSAFRKRRTELLEARKRWEAEQAAAAAAAAGAAIEGAEDAEASVARPVAGHVPADPPPDPSVLPEPELEPEPERTVRVVLVGEPGTVGAMRNRLRTLQGERKAPLDVEWSR